MTVVRAGSAVFDVDAIVFDKDGTLLDVDATWYRLSRAWVDAAAADTQPLADDLGERLGLGPNGLIPGGLLAVATFDELMEVTVETLRKHDVDAEARLIAAQVAAAEEMGKTSVAPLGDVVGAFERLSGAGLLLAVASNDVESMISHHLAELGVADHVASFIGADGPAIPKPHGGGLLVLAERLSVLPERMLVVGDSATDVGLARNGGAAGIVAVSPAHHPSTVEALADAVVSSIDELVLDEGNDPPGGGVG